MASHLPDPRSLESIDDAFKYPVVGVKGMEKKLRRDMDENHEKLRTLVGASYRDLLDTARTIVDINGQMQRVENILVDIGRRSDSRILDKMAANYARLDQNLRAQDAKQLALAAQLSVLQKVLNVITKLLRSHSSMLLAAKLLVVARLLQKTLSAANASYPLVEELGNRLSALRHRLLRNIDKELVRQHHDSNLIGEILSAFALATSSTPTDALRHFQRLRAEVICRRSMPEKTRTGTGIAHRIQLFLDTIRVSKAVFPDVLAASLKVLGARPLLADPVIVAIDELGLDVHTRWLTEEIKNYAPYTRHDELSKPKASQLLSGWAQETSEAMVDRIATDVRTETEVQHIVETRRDILQLWLSSRRSVIRGLDWTAMLTALRVPFVQQIKILVGKGSAGLEESVCSSILEQVDNWHTTKLSDNIGLWDLATTSIDLSDGAQDFREAIMMRKSGTNDATRMVLQAYDSRILRLQQFSVAVKTMKDSRWEDDFDDEEEDAEDAAPASEFLSKLDPQEIQDDLHEATRQAVHRMESTLENRLQSGKLDCSSPNASGLFLLRILRELQYRIPVLLGDMTREKPQTAFCQVLVESLHSNLAVTLVRQTHSAFNTSLRRFAASKYEVTSLWAGSPSLPVQPTPATFTFLRTVAMEMEALGSDLWSPNAVFRLQAKLGTMAGSLLRSVIEVLEQRFAVAQKKATMKAMQRRMKADQGSISEENEVVSANATASVKPETNGEGPAETPEESNSAAEEAQITPATNEDAGDAPSPHIQNLPNGNEEESTLELEAAEFEQPENGNSVVADTEDETQKAEAKVEAVANDPNEEPTPASDVQETPEHQLQDTAPDDPPELISATMRSVQVAAKLIQLLFDALYLCEAFAQPSVMKSPRQISSAEGDDSDESNSLQDVISLLIIKADVDEAAEARIRKTAKENWRRTYLLFGLLARG